MSLSITIGKHSSNVCKYTCSIFNVFISKIDTEIDNKRIFLQTGSDEQEMAIKMASKANFSLNFELNKLKIGKMLPKILYVEGKVLNYFTSAWKISVGFYFCNNFKNGRILKFNNCRNLNIIEVCKI